MSAGCRRASRVPSSHGNVQKCAHPLYVIVRNSLYMDRHMCRCTVHSYFKSLLDKVCAVFVLRHRRISDTVAFGAEGPEPVPADGAPQAASHRKAVKWKAVQRKVMPSAWT